ncbi:ankyrin repeat domain-containing protein [Mycena vulgaris]|nr:ankyrin repeat domain-containing protein [Mycena vulgaris]
MAEALGTIASVLQLVDTVLKAREYLKSFQDAPKEQQNLFSELEALRPLLAELLKRVADNPSSDVFLQMEAPLTTFKTTMEEFTKKLGPRDAISKFSVKLTWTMWSKKEAAGYLEQLERLKTLINGWLMMGVLDLGQRQITNQDGMIVAMKNIAHEQREHISAEKRRAILEWMSPLNFLQRQADVFSTLLPGTGEWLLEHAQFHEWEFGSGEVLWCHGIPGAGKTVLVSLVVNHLEIQAKENNIGLACIYLNHKETEIQTLPNLLGALWTQLMLGRSIPFIVDALYDHHNERQTRPPLKEFCKVLNAAITQYLKVYFIIDALDEYPEHLRHSFLQYLATLGPKINILITSRPHIGLDSVFSDLQILEIRATEDDICRYLTMQIKQSPRLSRHIKSRPELQDEIQSKIVDNSKGMFLLPKLHIESLASKNTIKAVCEALKHLPKDLQHTYNEAIERIHHQSEENKQLGLLALTWVGNAKRPLSVAELREALAIEPDSTFLDADNLLDMDIILSVCAGLITVDETVSVVRLIHYTTQGYLDSIQLDQFPLAHTTIVSTCLTYLSFEEFEHLTLPTARREQKEWVDKHPFLEYAKYCLGHANGQPELQLKNKIIAFLTKAPRWLDCYCWRDVSPWDDPFKGAGRGQGTKYFDSLWISAICNLEIIGRHLLSQEGLAPGTKDHALYAASYHGCIQMVQLLVDKGADMNTLGGYHGNALQAASVHGHGLAVHLLIETGANVNARGGHYGNALQAAAYSGHELVVQLLIKKGADVNVQGGQYGNALQAASLNGHKLVVQLLIDNGADVNTQGGGYGTALQAASYRGHESVVQLLINQGANVNAQGGPYGNALQAASLNGNEFVVQLLISKDADMNAQDGYFGNALQAASLNGHELVVQHLIEKGADVNAQGGHYGNALQAASYGGHEPVIQLLINKGAKVNVQEGYYGTALQAASSSGEWQAVQLLLNMGADVNLQGGVLGTPLQAASYQGHKSVVQLLIENSADVNAQGGYHTNALQAASCSGENKVIQLLIEKGADVNALGAKYGTALQAASGKGHTSTVQLLIQNGADVNIRGGKFGSALQAASVKSHKTVVQLLINNGADTSLLTGIELVYLSTRGI